MSKYTTELRFICEEYAGLDDSVGYNSVDEVVNGSYKKVFDFPYPIFDESYRDELEKKIIIHFYTREICEETVGLWKLRLRDKMNLIMPYYNQLYESELIEFDPMINIDQHIDDDYDKNRTDNTTRTDNLADTTTGGKSKTGHSETGRDGTNTETDRHNDWDLFSDTPQGAIDRIDLDENAYLTNARHTYGDGGTITDEEHSTTTVDSNDIQTINETVAHTGTQNRNGLVHTTNEGDKDVKGMDMTKMGSTPSKMIKEYRELFLNIDAMIIAELEELFIQLW